MHTAASGEFSVYLPNERNELTLASKTPNLITNQGLDNVSQAYWVDQFTGLVAGTGSTAPAFTDTKLQTQVLSSFQYSTIPSSYSTASFSNTNGATYNFVRAYVLRNTTGSSQTITELGTISGTSGSTNTNVFSRAVVPSFTLTAGSSAIVFYNLNLTCAATLTGTNMTFANGVLPTHYYGTVQLPFAFVDTTGATNTQSYGTHLEPSRPLYFKTSTTGYSLANFQATRIAYEADPLVQFPSNSLVPGWATLFPTTQESYVQGSYRKVYSITLSPGDIPGGEFRHISISSLNNTVYWGTGVWTTFSSAVTYNASNFFKYHYRLTWGR